ncbi:MAG TPA: hypothetical protein PKD90_14540 [Phnomibacter sp.]|nr:hypothetical protein [Phnomibacter sp.]
MQFVIKMFQPHKGLAASLALLGALGVHAQINSPYSRFGLGDMANARNVSTKAMGGLAAAYSDYQTVNFLNPASYANLPSVIFDVGMETEFRTIRNQPRTLSNQSGNIYFNYLAIGAPLSRDKKGRTNWGLAFGLRPYTRINYKLEDRTRLPNIDSSLTLYQGEGGAYRGFVGTGFRVGGFSAGVNAGFLFGQQNISSQRYLLNDSIFYFRANYSTKTSFNKFMLDGGVQYEAKLSKKTSLRLGATGFMRQTIKGFADLRRETFNFNSAGGTDTIDVVYRENNVPGNIEMPAGFSAGFMLDKAANWSFGAEYEKTLWNTYRFYGKQDNVGDASMIRVGGHWIPDAEATRGYFNRVAYRLGFYTGKDYITHNGNQLPVWGITFGANLPIRRHNLYSYQFTSINTSFEIGRRGNAVVPVAESFFKINLGFNLSDVWFQKIKYD